VIAVVEKSADESTACAPITRGGEREGRRHDRGRACPQRGEATPSRQSPRQPGQGAPVRFTAGGRLCLQGRPMPRPIRRRCPPAPAPIDGVREVEAFRVQEHTQAATRPDVIALRAEVHALRAELAARGRPYDMSGGFRSPTISGQAHQPSAGLYRTSTVSRIGSIEKGRHDPQGGRRLQTAGWCRA